MDLEDSADLVDLTDSADSTDSLGYFFKRFLSFIYSATKGFISSSKLSSELYFPGTCSMDYFDCDFSF